jgi:hypothetical protein
VIAMDGAVFNHAYLEARILLVLGVDGFRIDFGAPLERGPWSVRGFTLSLSVAILSIETDEVEVLSYSCHSTCKYN